jgi:hypothetical protein
MDGNVVMYDRSEDPVHDENPTLGHFSSLEYYYFKMALLVALEAEEFASTLNSLQKTLTSYKDFKCWLLYTPSSFTWCDALMIVANS